MLIQHSDIESLTCCHWNVNSLTAHKMLKKSLIEAYNTSHKCDFICISETYLDSAVAADDKDLAIDVYNIVRADFFFYQMPYTSLQTK